MQPYWRHLLERIKRGIDPYVLAESSSEVDDEESAEDASIAGAVSNTNASTNLDKSRSEVDPDSGSDLQSQSNPESESELESESRAGSRWPSRSEFGLGTDPHGYPTVISIRSDCVYDEDEIVCMNCWLFYVRTGTRLTPARGRRIF